jgi:hypothetical protein
MVELADIFRRYGAGYRARFGRHMLPSHIRAIEDIVNCRTPQMGGHLYQCQNPSCQHYVYSYHSCCNRSCPKCGQDRSQHWLIKQQKLLIPSHYFLVSFTLPSELRPIARSNQKLIYDLLFKASAAALQKLAQDPRFIGGQIGMMGGLHTWRRDMCYHPHVHYIVAGGGLSTDNTQWLPSRDEFLVPVEALSPIFRAKFRDALKKTDLFDQLPEHVWQKHWVVHSKPLEDGHKALKYLAPYVCRVAITNNRILKIENDQVTFRYKDSQTDQWQLATLPAMEFIRRFLQHVLPKGFIKIRYYGFLSPANRHKLAIIRYILGHITSHIEPSGYKHNHYCPRCGGEMRLIMTIIPLKRGPPQL